MWQEGKALISAYRRWMGQYRLLSDWIPVAVEHMKAYISCIKYPERIIMLPIQHCEQLVLLKVRRFTNNTIIHWSVCMTSKCKSVIIYFMKFIAPAIASSSYRRNCIRVEAHRSRRSASPMASLRKLLNMCHVHLQLEQHTCQWIPHHTGTKDVNR